MYSKILVQFLKNPRHIRFGKHSCLLKDQKFYHELPFIGLYKKITDQAVPENLLPKLKEKYPKILGLDKDQLQYTLKILSKFGLTAEDACLNPHLFCMNPLSMDNYGEILKECNFTVILPKHIIRYHTLVRSRTISQLKKDGLLREDLNLEELLYHYFYDWPKDHMKFNNFSDSSTNILTVRMSILERYLHYKLCITEEEFKKYCRNYLPLKHRPFCDIKEALEIAQNDIKFTIDTIRRNGFIISSDPVNTKLILEKVDSLSGLDIREAIKIEPAILKNHYQALLDIRDVLQQYNISNEAQRRCFKVYCMKPETVQERLEQLVNLKEYQVLATNPRVLYMVIHERKMMKRLTKIQAAQKQCFSLNHLVSSTKIFNTYINSFGNKICGRDIGVLISSSLTGTEITDKAVIDKLKRHKYWLHTALNVVAENIQMLKKTFNDDVIFNNCQILLYPGLEIQRYIEYLTKLRVSASFNTSDSNIKLDYSYKNLNKRILSNDQILSLILYEIEKKYHFSGDGIWNKVDGSKNDTQKSGQRQKNSAN